MRPINIAVEISPLLSASGIQGDKSGVYRYMIGLIQSLIQNKQKYGNIVLFSFNCDSFTSQINPDYIDLLLNSRVKLCNSFNVQFSEPRVESLMRKFVLNTQFIKTLFKIFDHFIHIKKIYKNINDRKKFLQYIQYLDTQFRRNNVKIIFHSETGFFHMNGYKNIITMYDLTPFLFRYFHQEETIDLHKRKLYFIKNHCEGIICISNSTKKDLLLYCPELSNRHICVLYPGLDNSIQEFLHYKRHENIFKDIVKLGNNKSQEIRSKQYLFYYGTFEPRKNLLYLVRSFIDLQKQKQISSHFKLIMVGGNGWGGIKNMIRAYLNENFPLINKNNILLFDFLGDQYVYSLISHAYATVYPSLYEGFGLPVLESMALGTPVICSNNSSLPEVGGNAVLYFDAENIDDMKISISKIIRNHSLPNILSKKGKIQSKKFSWLKTTSNLYNFLNILIK